jgi:tetratricopeptide (TPR) repeat protein
VNEPVLDPPRRVIPRWRDFLTTASLGELSFFGHRKHVIEWTSGLVEAQKAWGDSRNELTAGELLMEAVVQRNWPLATEAARYIVRDGSKAPQFTKDLATRILARSQNEGEEDQGSIEETPAFDPNIIGQLRVRLKIFPHDPIRWIELALAYVIIGKHEAARRAILTGIALAPDDRFVLRSAARFFVHQHDPDMALRALARSRNTMNDPWLLAAHIAVSDVAERHPKFYRAAKSAFESDDFRLFDKAELGTALGSLELASGNDKRSRILFNRALVDPTENAAAQAVWAHKAVGLTKVDQLLRLPRSFEANARTLIQLEQWDNAVKATRKWRDDEPFSGRPAILSSYLESTVTENFADAERIAASGLRANPGDGTLVNNVAFAQACQGKLAEAIETLKAGASAQLSNEERISMTATQGLIAFRSGNVEAGRTKYREAVDLADNLGIKRHQAVAAAYLAREEIRAKTSRVPAAIREAESLFQKHGAQDPIVRLVMSKLGAEGKAHLERQNKAS